MIYHWRVDHATIARLLQPYANIGQRQVQNISIYIDILLKWNSRINLTAVRDAEQIVTRHFGESLFAAAQLVAPDWSGTVIDVGSGAGFPGLPFAFFAPNASVTLIESHGKKVAFLNEVIFALELKNVKVWAGRAESFPGAAALVTMRAVERFEAALPTASRLVAPSGRLALMIGASQVSVATERVSELDWSAPVDVPGGTSRVLLVGTKRVNSGLSL